MLVPLAISEDQLLRRFRPVVASAAVDVCGRFAVFAVIRPFAED